MTALGVFLVAAALLAIERVCYVWVWRSAPAFRRLCARPPLRRWGDPVEVLERMFYGFKAIQLAVFAGWCWWFGDGRLWPATAAPLPIGLGVGLMAVGQVLNVAVFQRLGRTGVFYGTRLGHHVPWCTRFPFSVLRHPQYVGTVLSIWGLFLVMRFPAPDWFALPALETAYYVLGGWLESTPVGAEADEPEPGRRPAGQGSPTGTPSPISTLESTASVRWT